jgi:hypothetical protein
VEQRGERWVHTKRGDGNGEVVAAEGWSGALPIGRGPRVLPPDEGVGRAHHCHHESQGEKRVALGMREARR